MKYIIHIILVASVVVAATDDDWHTSHDDWRDPHDMFGEQTVAKKNPKSEVVCEKCLDENEILKKCNCSDCTTTVNGDGDMKTYDHIFMRRIMRFYLSQLSNVGIPPAQTHYKILVELNGNDWEVLSNYVEDKNDIPIPHVMKVFENSFKTISTGHADDQSWELKFEEYFHLSIDDAIKCCVLLLLIVATLTLQFVSLISWATQFKRLLVLLLIQSFIMTYIHEYQVTLAEHKSESSKIPESCQQSMRKLTTVEAFTQTFRDMFSTAKHPCTQYHENFIISPFVKVPPTKIIAVTMTRFLLEPLTHIGTSFSLTFKNMFSQLPLQLWIPAFVFIIICMLTVLMFLTVCFGYSWTLNLPFWSGFQIAPQQQQQQQHMQQMLDNYNRHQLHAIQELLNERRPTNNNEPGMLRSIMSSIGLRSNHDAPPNPRTPQEPVPAASQPTPPPGVRRRTPRTPLNDLPDDTDHPTPNQPPFAHNPPPYPAEPTNLPYPSEPTHPPQSPHTRPQPPTHPLPRSNSQAPEHDLHATGDFSDIFPTNSHRPCQVEEIPQTDTSHVCNDDVIMDNNHIVRDIGFVCDATIVPRPVSSDDTHPKRHGQQTAASSQNNKD
uniref:chloride channel CLIC-like protein 1 n=1 Tax=Ciona intestinalis TaxID=7719 RepID=UPI0002B8E2AA|nr:chloride channel CLIC-like protein 1 [Ciona intestinalis]|eukprot:XP_002126413.2 chloride channel CLIC-like protein 1 [Ciona intestinalis]